MDWYDDPFFLPHSKMKIRLMRRTVKTGMFTSALTRDAPVF